MLNTSHGLPSAEILALGNDHKGYLWVGTNVGISKYDGHGFENFQYSSDNYLIGKVNVIKEDKKHRLWIGADAGLFVGINNRIFKVSRNNEPKQGVYSIYLEKTSSLCLGTLAGPAMIDSATANAMAQKHSFDLRKYIVSSWPTLIQEKEGAAIVDKSEDGSYFFAGRSTLHQYTEGAVNTIYVNPDRHDIIMRLFPAGRNKIYFYTALSGWHKIDNGQYAKLPSLETDLPYDSSSENVIVLGSRNVYRFYPATGIIKTHINLRDYGVIWPSDLLVDPQNNMWVATHDGLLKLQPSFFKKYPPEQYSIPDEIFSMCETANGELLLGSNRGLIFSRAADGFKPYHPDKVVPLAEVYAMYEDQNKWLWFATGYQGIAVYRNKKLEHFKIGDGLRNNSNFSFFTTSNGRFFVMGDEGISEILIHPGNESISFRNYYYRPVTTIDAKFFSCIESIDGVLWIGGQEGLFCLSGDSLKKFDLLDRAISIRDIKKDAKGNVWLATEGEGILKCRFDERNLLTVIDKYDIEDGLNTNIFNKLLIDQNGNVWISSYKGISLIGKEKNSIANFDGSDGFINTSFYGLFLHQDRSGIIWAGCSRGITSFDPEEIPFTSYRPPVYITGISLTNTQDDIFQFGEGDKNNLPATLLLPHNKNYLKFQYAAIDFNNQDNLQYLYKLDGLDTGWVNAGGSRFVIFEHLPPGKYKFIIKSVNNKGVLSNSVADYAFVIQRPFWQTWWFGLFAMLFIISIVWWIVRKKIETVRKEMKMKNKLSETKMIALRAQMNPHFIFNSLNAINIFILENNKLLASGYLTKFSKLVRMILENSQASLITLESELVSLELYLDLEALRFDHHFSYRISVSKDLDLEVLKIPPLIIQPYAENAIWHGLMHKEEKGHLDIEVRQEDQCLFLKIKDDGIGRKQAGALTGKSPTHHKSMGLQITADRIAILQNSNGNESVITINDLVHADGSPAGTEVIIKIPVLYD